MVIKRLAAVALTALFASAPAHSAYRFEDGRATDLESGRPLYREQHLLRMDGAAPVERMVLYRCNDGTPFARKRVDYRASPNAPAFQFEDVRSGYREGVERSTSGARVFVDRPDDVEESAALPSGALVADAGFDQWVRGSWTQLAAGESVPMEFLVPSRLTSYGFKVYEVDPSEAGAVNARRFRLRLGGLLGWFAPHIDVVYAESDRRLLSFEGLSNLRDDAGEDPLKVRIEFPAAPVPGKSEDWQRLALEPLRSCRVGV